MFLCLLSLLLLPIFSVAALWYINGSAPNIVITLAKNGVSTLTPLILRVFLVVVRFIESSRSTYVWETRAMSPAFVRRVLDWGMVVDASEAKLCVSSGHDSIRIDEAIASYEGEDYDVKDMLEMMWICGNGDSVVFNLSRCLSYEDVIVGRYSDITLRIKYSGHSNKKKKTPPQTFSVRYSGNCMNISHFPPYPASESIKKGLGTVKIVKAKREDGNCCLQEARESSGLHGKFYNDIDTEDAMVKNSVTFFEESDRIHEDLKIEVTTSKGVININ